MEIKSESLPERCEVCHKADRFDPVNNHCLRCAGVEEVVQEQPNNLIPFPQAAVNPTPDQIPRRTLTPVTLTPEEFAHRMLNDTERLTHQMLNGGVRLESRNAVFSPPRQQDDPFSNNAPATTEIGRLSVVLLSIVLLFPISYAVYILYSVFSAHTPAEAHAAVVTTHQEQLAGAKKAPAPKVNLPKPEKPKPVDPNKIYSVGKDGVTNPIIIEKHKPYYTEGARQDKIQGTVTLEVIFQKDETVKVSRVVQGLGYGLDEEAAKAAVLIKFKPGRKDGIPVNVRGRLVFTFDIL